MMLLMVEDIEEKRIAQNKLEDSIHRHLNYQGIKNIGFPSGNVDEPLYANASNSLWAAFTDVKDAPIPRRWNAFGIFDAKRHAQVITVEINIPTTTNSPRVAGFFARDPLTQEIYLMHDGSIGGGRAGVGRSAFLAWSKAELQDVRRANDDDRAGIVIGRIESDDLTGRLWRFVQLVNGFKDAVIRGELEDPEMQQAINEWENYKSEGSGRRQGRRSSEIDYISYHGDVVQQLFEERQSRRVDGERVLNSKLIDLYVRNGQTLTEIYEVKTSLDRQSIYTAIGQLVSHSTDAIQGVKRTLVLPVGKLPPDLEKSLASLSIQVRHFAISSGPTPQVVLSQ
jgi:hypothetical protein